VLAKPASLTAMVARRRCGVERPPLHRKRGGLWVGSIGWRMLWCSSPSSDHHGGVTGKVRSASSSSCCKVLLKDLFFGGLLTDDWSIIPPDFKAIGKPLRSCSGSIRWHLTAHRSKWYIPGGCVVDRAQSLAIDLEVKEDEGLGRVLLSSPGGLCNVIGPGL
jgi:hypothetical protein